MKFEQYCQDARDFVNEIAVELGEPANKGQAERIMTSVLHTVREVLSPEESLHFIAQLPMMMKGIYVDGWRLETQNRIRSMNEFIECLILQSPRTALNDFGNGEKAETNARAVLRVLSRHVATGEVKDIVSQFPVELADLWRNETEATERAQTK
ncbi:DUF2267 domain-containing protein [Chryseolinea soli]|uniref:DUF2267 domain-containing protein n=1 Tax=Chryseolinea soli TaxID=2321403 RepID=A0A385SRP6_9BACT|nr:DUF2267 domain-containing protein [Chryseolinea soli]AYB32971.1 DUF2267 domain-containing protein [Chryseolinea soli]